MTICALREAITFGAVNEHEKQVCIFFCPVVTSKTLKTIQNQFISSGWNWFFFLRSDVLIDDMLLSQVANFFTPSPKDTSERFSSSTSFMSAFRAYPLFFADNAA